MRRQPRGWPLHGGRHREVQTWRRQRGDARIQTRNTKQHDFNISGWLMSQTTYKFVFESGQYERLILAAFCVKLKHILFSPTSFTVSRS